MNVAPDLNAQHAADVGHSRISVAEPVLDGRETEYVLECLRTNWISSHGRFISQFERTFAAYCGVRHAVAVSNGTAALHLCLVALGVKEGDEIIVPESHLCRDSQRCSLLQCHSSFRRQRFTHLQYRRG